MLTPCTHCGSRNDVQRVTLADGRAMKPCATDRLPHRISAITLPYHAQLLRAIASGDEAEAFSLARQIHYDAVVDHPEMFPEPEWSSTVREWAAPDLKRMRTAKGETIRRVSDAIGCTEKSYSSWEGRQRQPESNYLIALADHFDVDPRAILAATRPLATVDVVKG